MNNELIDELRKYAAELEELIQVYDEKIKRYDKQRWNVSSVMHALNDFLAKHDNLNGEPKKPEENLTDLEAQVLKVIEEFPEMTFEQIYKQVEGGVPGVKRIAVSDAVIDLYGKRKIARSSGRDNFYRYYVESK